MHYDSLLRRYFFAVSDIEFAQSFVSQHSDAMVLYDRGSFYVAVPDYYKF